MKGYPTCCSQHINLMNFRHVKKRQVDTNHVDPTLGHFFSSSIL